MRSGKKGFISVHVGAGYHSVLKEKALCDLCRKVCCLAMEELRSGSTAVDVCALAIKMLEDDPLVNAGFGSSLNYVGEVECDAGIMDDQGFFGAVGAVQNVKNPILLAKNILEHQKLPQSMLVPPMLLVSGGAYSRAKSVGLETFPSDQKNSLISDHAQKQYEEHLKILHQNPPKCFDTVGAVCMDSYGDLASGVSSGGISLKLPGRVGDSAIYGAGCWTAKSQSNADIDYACSTTGTGEQLMQTLFAKSLNDRLINGLRSELQREEILSDFLYEFMQKSKREPKAAGFISIIGKEDDYEFWFGHTTESMGYGYMFESDDRAFAEVSRKNVYSPFCLSCLPIN